MENQSSWITKIGRIVCLNLLHREDRLLDFTKMMEEYEIPFERIDAISDEQGARGLRDTMVKVFQDAIGNNYHNILVFEDDCELLPEKGKFNVVMDEVMKQLPENYWMLFLGCQLTGNGCRFHSTNIIRGTKMFATHAVLYSLQGIKEIMAREFKYPIDNFYVNELQEHQHCYCTFPLLASQRISFSDIGRQVQNWKPFIDDRYRQQINNIRR